MSEQETEYVSSSTIDREPRPPKDEKADQKEMFDREKHERETSEYLANKTPGAVSFKLTLKIDGNGFSNTISFGGDDVSAAYFEETLTKRLAGEYFLQQIRGICGEQKMSPVQEELTLRNPLTAGHQEPETGEEEKTEEAEAPATTEGEPAAETETEKVEEEPSEPTKKKVKPLKPKFKVVEPAAVLELEHEPADPRDKQDPDDIDL